ncbi:MAG TPA: HDIG domain-containing protein [bacterium]|nr:HDIG domain-containing protein [bacterium]
MIRATREKQRALAERWERVKDRYYEWLKLSERRTAILVLFVFSALAAYLTIPETTMSFLPTRDSDVGRVMKFSVRADRDYDIIDEDATARVRDAALGKVLRHYAYRENNPAYQKMRKAFSAMRERATNILMEKGLAGADAVPPEFAVLYREALDRNLMTVVPENLRGDIYLAIDEGKREFDKAVGFEVNDELFSLLRGGFFSVELEDAIFAIVDRLDNYYLTREGLGESYQLDKIAVKKGETVAKRPRYRVISEQSLAAEIAYAQRSLRQNVEFTEKGLALIAAAAHTFLRDNIVYDEKLNERMQKDALQSTLPVIIKVKNGEIIARAGDVITKRQVSVFRDIVEKKKEKPVVIIFLEHLAFIMFTAAVSFFSFRRSVSKFSVRNKDVLLMSFLALLTVLLTYGITSISVPFSQWMGNIDARVFNFLLPFPFIVATVRLLINTETALFFIITVTLLFANVFPDNYYFPAYYTISALFYLFLITHIDRRSHVLRVSLSLAGLQLILALLIFLMDSTLPQENLLRGLAVAFSSGIISALLLLGLIPLWEGLFGYTTDITYLELTSMQHPLMARLVTEANGSYQHSLMVGVMVEDAARRIHVNPLACKVMAYYHDIGKLHGPFYYSENQGGQNIHDTLTPLESTRIIVNHVTHGIELARSYKLGEKIEAAIRHHHGTSFVKYFYDKALQQDPQAPSAQYRYPGPKPHSKDVALIMLADSTEAAIRSMKEKNYQKITDGVRNIIGRIMADGQLSECNMTMRDLSIIEDSFIKTLSGQYHARVEYQQPVA